MRGEDGDDVAGASLEVRDEPWQNGFNGVPVPKKDEVGECLTGSSSIVDLVGEVSLTPEKIPQFRIVIGRSPGSPG